MLLRSHNAIMLPIRCVIAGSQAYKQDVDHQGVACSTGRGKEGQTEREGQGRARGEGEEA